MKNPFAPRPVKSILSGIHSLVTELRESSQWHANKAAELRNKADEHAVESRDASASADFFSQGLPKS